MNVDVKVKKVTIQLAADEQPVEFEFLLREGVQWLSLLNLPALVETMFEALDPSMKNRYELNVYADSDCPAAEVTDLMKASTKEQIMGEFYHTYTMAIDCFELKLKARLSAKQ